jgi:hypothetical protein
MDDWRLVHDLDKSPDPRAIRFHPLAYKEIIGKKFRGSVVAPPTAGSAFLDNLDNRVCKSESVSLNTNTRTSSAARQDVSRLFLEQHLHQTRDL